MATIGFIRHGITDWNHIGKAQGISDIPLNDEGKKQAMALARRLSQEKWDYIISSNLIRAIETARIIGKEISLPISRIEERVQEINLGKIEGTTEEERLQVWGPNWRNYDTGMEKFEDVAKRGIEFLEEIHLTYKEKRVLVISHGALIGLTLQHLLPEKFQRTYLDNTSITILNKMGEQWNCSLYNCTKHLGQQ